MSQCKYCLGIGRVIKQHVSDYGTTIASEECPHGQEAKPLHTCGECKHWAPVSFGGLGRCAAISAEDEHLDMLISGTATGPCVGFVKRESKPDA